MATQLLLCAHAMCFIAAYETFSHLTPPSRMNKTRLKMNATICHNNASTTNWLAMKLLWFRSAIIGLIDFLFRIKCVMSVEYVFETCIAFDRTIQSDRRRFFYDVSYFAQFRSSMRYRLPCNLEHAPEVATEKKLREREKAIHKRYSRERIENMAINFRRNYELRGCWNTNLLVNVVPMNNNNFDYAPFEHERRKFSNR